MGRGNYPTPAQVSVFVGDVWVDDAYRIEFRDQNQLIPLYGYADKEFTAVAQGKRLVQGSLIINFRYPEYLRAAIEGHGSKRVEMDKAIALAHQLRNAPIEERIALLEEARMRGVGKEIGKVYVNQYVPEAELADIGDLTPAEFEAFGEENYNSVVPSTMALSPDEEINFKIYFDTPEYSRYYTMIRGVRLVGRAMTVSNAVGGGDAGGSGMPLYEIYSFFARKVENKKIQKWTNDPTQPGYGVDGLSEVLGSTTPTPKTEGSES